jgi:TonB family protein
MTIRGEPEGLRRAMSFASSAVLHGAALAWVAIGGTLLPGEKPQSLYDQEIKPHASHIVWYGVRNSLPDLKPAAPKAAARPLRAVREFKQQIVSRAREDARPPQAILMPAPEIRLPKPLPLPNVLAVAAVPRPVRPFLPPREKGMAEPAPAQLPEAPPVVATTPVKDLALGLARPKAPPLPFQPPPEVKRTAPAAAVLPAAPPVAAAAPRFDPPRIPRSFTPPATKRAPDPAPAADLSTDAPPLSPATLQAEPSLVIVGLRPVELPAIPTPPGSHEAGFSAGTKLRPEGGDTDSKDAALTAPGLLTRGGTKEAQAALLASLDSPTSARSLMDGMRRMRDDGALIPPGPASNASRVSSPPDPRLAGRAVYVMAIQMPNITSYSGSWLVWFAEREVQGQAPFEVRPPVPVHKVDPKYIVSARDERVEGSVRLFAIIRRTGQVDSVELLQHLDARLDRSAEEALLKWQFEPATRDGVPVDVEAVFEIPFRLKPPEAR